MTPIKEEFIVKARKVHGNKYDYSKVNYINSYTHVIIICKEHGDFNQTPGSHLTGRGCPICSGKLQSNTSEFIKKAKAIHGNKYDYSEVKYTKAREPVNIICKDHGSFFQTPNNHLNGQKCPWCISRNIKDTKEFIKRARNTHGNKYNYQKTIWINSRTKVIIICPIHGEFEQNPTEHIRGRGCKICGDLKQSIEKRSTKKEFIIKANKKHASTYDYSKVKYITGNVSVIIICKKHGEFSIKPNSHLKGAGCPICNVSTGELTIKAILDKYNIQYIREYKIPNQQYRFRYDFYLPDYNLLIEFHGVQHYEPVEYFGGIQGLSSMQLRDSSKKTLAKTLSYNLIEIHYKYLDFLSEEQFENKLIQLINKFK